MIKSIEFQKITQDLEKDCCDLTKDGKCTGCGSCCSNFLVMTEKEIATIQKYVKKHNIKEQRHVFPVNQPTMDFTCPFLNDSKKCDKCEIYEVRPRICRDFICSWKKDGHLMEPEYSMKAKCVDMRMTFFNAKY